MEAIELEDMFLYSTLDDALSLNEEATFDLGLSSQKLDKSLMTDVYNGGKMFFHYFLVCRYLYDYLYT